MAKNRVQIGKHLTMTHDNLAGAVSGEPVIVGGITGVALIDADTDNKCTFDTEGVYNLPVRGHNGSANAAVAVGAPVYFIVGQAYLNVKTTDTLFGYALAAVTSGSTTTIPVLLHK